MFINTKKTQTINDQIRPKCSIKTNKHKKTKSKTSSSFPGTTSEKQKTPSKGKHSHETRLNNQNHLRVRESREGQGSNTNKLKSKGNGIKQRIIRKNLWHILRPPETFGLLTISENDGSLITNQPPETTNMIQNNEQTKDTLTKRV